MPRYDPGYFVELARVRHAAIEDDGGPNDEDYDEERPTLSLSASLGVHHIGTFKHG